MLVFVLGWAVLYLFYQKYDKTEGIDMAQGMINKYSDDERTTSDYFTEFEDLAWTYKICPKTVFFRTAILLLKMRVYSWVEQALAQEIQNHYGLTHYLLSAVCFYKKMYDHALEHINETKSAYGSDYAVSSLAGHCLLALDRHEEAKEEYYHVLESYNRPDDVHMVYINSARVLSNMGSSQDARKFMLLACKYSPTPYTWFKTGELYLEAGFLQHGIYKNKCIYRMFIKYGAEIQGENDLLSAEECFTESNYEDNRCPEVWAYLAIVNLRLSRTNEAELCYRQAIKNKLKCPGLLEMMNSEFGIKNCPFV
ncbi:hypothetical protein NQ317_016713 [Molorchus minor]|uniref:Uncharacterized protein n=1 Tax=Molorchus minor TaxID=1323400 RepID=A0ABQ9J727_9CUCU|nr:hypothetical protein NQ317_016713 [Molorchus minor]